MAANLAVIKMGSKPTITLTRIGKVIKAARAVVVLKAQVRILQITAILIRF